MVSCVSHNKVSSVFASKRANFVAHMLFARSCRYCVLSEDNMARQHSISPSATSIVADDDPLPSFIVAQRKGTEGCMFGLVWHETTIALAGHVAGFDAPLSSRSSFRAASYFDRRVSLKCPFASHFKRNALRCKLILCVCFLRKMQF